MLAVLPLVSASSVDFSIVGRVDYPLDYNLYTFLDGDIGEHVSYSFSNHWVSKDTKALYQNTWRSWDVNWCDWANFTFSFGGLSITVGKDLLLTGSNEEMPNDVDNYAFLCSEFWNNLQMYQWGGKIAYKFSSINTTFEAQFCSSPFDEKPFQKNGAVSFGLSGEYGIYQPHFTANCIRYDTADYEARQRRRRESARISSSFVSSSMARIRLSASFTFELSRRKAFRELSSRAMME